MLCMYVCIHVCIHMLEIWSMSVYICTHTHVSWNLQQQRQRRQRRGGGGGWWWGGGGGRQRRLTILPLPLLLLLQLENQRPVTLWHCLRLRSYSFACSMSCWWVSAPFSVRASHHMSYAPASPWIKSPWIAMIHHDLSCITMDLDHYGSLWITMDHQRSLWITKMFCFPCNGSETRI